MNFGRTHYNKRKERKQDEQSVEEEETNRDLSQALVFRAELSKALCTYQETSQAAI